MSRGGNRVAHHITYPERDRWPCWCAAGGDHDDQQPEFLAIVRAERESRAVAIFEKRMGFAYTEDYEQSREWSDALAKAAQT